MAQETGSVQTKPAGPAENYEECLFRCDSAGLGTSPPEQSELYKSHSGPGRIVKVTSFGGRGWVFFEGGTVCQFLLCRQGASVLSACSLQAPGPHRVVVPGSQGLAILRTFINSLVCSRADVLHSRLNDSLCWKQPSLRRKGRSVTGGRPAQMLGRSQTHGHASFLVNQFMGTYFPDHSTVSGA